MGIYVCENPRPLNQQIENRLGAIIEGIDRILYMNETFTFLTFVDKKVENHKCFQFMTHLKNLIARKHWEECLKYFTKEKTDYLEFPKLMRDVWRENMKEISICLSYLNGKYSQELMEKRLEGFYKGESSVENNFS